jgi:HAD superfamily hydrolase (TIGR01509 family)
MKIKLIIFDLDGVLVDSRPLHYNALNAALRDMDEKYVINLEEHLAKYDGLSTKQKMELLTKEKGLPSNLYSKVWSLKQEKTFDIINETFTFDENKRNLLKTLKEDGYTLYCASNSIWNTVKLMLLRTGLLEYFDYFISNEEVRNPKPSPEIYMNCITRAKLSVNEVMICEDSPIGKASAVASGAHLCPIEDPNDLTLNKLRQYIQHYEWKNENGGGDELSMIKTKPINILIPMAGHGSRFAGVGYTVPKPLIQINNKAMIQIVVENISLVGNYIFLVRSDHYEKYDLGNFLNKIAPGCKIVQVDKVTEGAACTTLLAEEYIDSDTPLLIANSDQYLVWSPTQFLYQAMSEGVDGSIATFYNTNPKWSYAKLDKNGFVTEVQEKNVISTTATVGVYFFKSGKEYVNYAKQMIGKNIRVNGEFYVCPIYNELIGDGKKIKVHEVKAMHGLGTPLDLNLFLENYDISKL